MNERNRPVHCAGCVKELPDRKCPYYLPRDHGGIEHDFLGEGRRKVFESRTGITVSTIHGVKGAEYDTVIAYALLEGMVPHFADSDGEVSANKLLYVIASRARKNLHLIAERGRMGDPFGAQTF